MARVAQVREWDKPETRFLRAVSVLFPTLLLIDAARQALTGRRGMWEALPCAVMILFAVAFLREGERWACLRQDEAAPVEGEGLAGAAGLFLVAAWAVLLLGLEAAALRRPATRVPPEAFKAALQFAGVVLAAAVSRRAFERALPRWRASHGRSADPSWVAGCRVLDLLPANVGLTRAELAARLGAAPPAGALEALVAEGLVEATVKREGEAPRYGWRVGVKLDFDFLTGMAFWKMTERGGPATVKEFMAAEGERQGKMERALWRLAARGWIEEDLASPVGVGRAYRLTPLGAEVDRATDVLAEKMPHEGSGIGVDEVREMAGCDERVARAALDQMVLSCLAEPVSGGAEPRYRLILDPNGRFQWVETWEEKRAKDVN